MRAKELESLDWKDSLYSAHAFTSQHITMEFQGAGDKKRRCWKFPEKSKLVTHETRAEPQWDPTCQQWTWKQEVKGWAMASDLHVHNCLSAVNQTCRERADVGGLKHLYPGSHWTICCNKQHQETKGVILETGISLGERVKEFLG